MTLTNTEKVCFPIGRYRSRLRDLNSEAVEMQYSLSKSLFKAAYHTQITAESGDGARKKALVEIYKKNGFWTPQKPNTTVRTSYPR